MLEKAGNSEGYKHTPETKAILAIKATGRTHSPEVRKAMSENRKGELGPFHGHHHTLENKAILREYALNRQKSHKPGFTVEVVDITTNVTTIYRSMREVSRALKLDRGAWVKREKQGITTPFRGKYVIKILSKKSPQG